MEAGASCGSCGKVKSRRAVSNGNTIGVSTKPSAEIVVVAQKKEICDMVLVLLTTYVLYLVEFYGTLSE